MIDLQGVRIGFAMTGSFCTFQHAFAQAEYLVSCGAQLLPIMSYHAAQTSTRFGDAKAQRERIEEIAGRKVICTIEDAEPIGPLQLTDVMAVVHLEYSGEARPQHHGYTGHNGGQIPSAKRKARGSGSGIE